MNSASAARESETNVAVAEEEPVEPVAVKRTDCIPGTILSTGDYLVEMGTQRPIKQEDLLVALAMMGWGEVLLDQSITKPGAAEESVSKEWGLWSQPEGVFVNRFRFLGRLEETIQIAEHPAISWLYLQGIAFDAIGDLTRLEVFPHQLRAGELYEMRFLSRISKTERKNREVLFEQLKEMGWDTMKLSALKRNIRLPGNSGASVTSWYGFARWTGPMSYITDEDPLYFEDVVLVR